MSIPFGGIDLDPVELGINGNAILGIKESGKSYLGTELGEVFFEAGIPFIAFDPIGIWHNMRYPGRGKGFPVVVAGGFHGDIPLTPANAPSIVEAAMKERVSLVLDLFHPELSKADWRKIVRDCAFLLLHKNAAYGLRHIFIEEAAEFVPQQPRDTQVYDAVERVIRMGGNSRLGCTLISPRSQEVNKAVLELCENLFLFRQRGKNALENIKKWLDVAGAEAKDVMRTLPNMPTGECWAWLGGSDHPVHVKVPRKRSFHPDRRATAEDVGAIPTGKPADVKKFVGALEKALPAIEEEIKANDPKALRARVAELEKEIAGLTALSSRPGTALISITAERDALIGSVRDLQSEVGQLRPAAAAMKMIGPLLEEVFMAVERAAEAIRTVDAAVDRVQKARETVDLEALPKPGPLKAVPPPPFLSPRDSLNAMNERIVLVDGETSITGPRQLILDKIAWARVFFNDPAVERSVLGFLVKKHKRTKSFLNDLSGLKTGGFIEYMSGDRVQLTPAGEAQAADPGTPNHGELIAGVKEQLSKRQGEILDWALGAQQHGGLITREAVADAFNLHVRTKSFLNDLSRVKSLGLIYYSGTSIGAADFLRER